VTEPGPHRWYLFAFEDAARARIFVKRLVLNLRRLAIYVDGEHVRVIDGSPEGQHAEIIRLAKGSEAQLTSFGGPLGGP
jgi:hypothetical protein